MQPIYIIGYMGSGKTTFGRALAKRLDMQFIDLDFYITQRFRKSIPEIFAEKGEAGFRRLETNMLHEAGEFENVVISCGGGTPCFYDNIDYMLSNGLVICMNASKSRLLERLCANPSQRPAIKGKTQDEIASVIEDGLRDRAPFYSRAHIQFNGENLEDRHMIASSVDYFITKYRDFIADFL